MFVKETYDQRIKQQQGPKHRSLKNNKPPAIGSTKNDKMNYDREQQFFTKEDVPHHARTIKQNVKHLIDPDHLGLRKKNWNTSVSVPKKMQSEQTHQQRLLKIKLGFSDNPQPKYKQQKIYEGTDTRNDYTNWNVSNQILKNQMKQNFQKTTMMAFENSKNKQKQLLHQYLDPLHKTTNFISSFQKDWKNKAQLRQQLKQKYIFDNPIASQQKINAAVFRLAYQTEIKKKKDDIEAIAMKTDYKPTLSQKQKKKIGMKFWHPGVWQPINQKDGTQIQQIWAWSCCLNQDKDSRGCTCKVIDGNKWNLGGFTA